jgi:hypothetical protein
MRILSYANENRPGLVNFEKSINVHTGWQFDQIGRGATWYGWQSRIKSYATECRKLPPAEVVVLSDAYDVLCVSDCSGFEEMFMTLHVDIVVGALRYFSSLNTTFMHAYWAFHHEENEKWRYPNCGLMCGKAGALADMWDWIVGQNFQDDQLGVCAYMNKFPAGCRLDCQSSLFLNDNLATEDYHFSPTKVLCKNDVTLTSYFIHFPSMVTIASIPALHPYQKPFRPGVNYDIVGKIVNGLDHVIFSEVDYRAYTVSLWLERGLWLLFILIVVGCLVTKIRFTSKCLAKAKLQNLTLSKQHRTSGF